MNYKRVLILCIFALIIVSSLTVVSAGWFDFLGGEPEKSNTTIQCWSNDAGDGLIIHLATPSPGDLQTNSSSRIVYVNVTDENNNTEQYNISEWEPDDLGTPGYGKCYLKHTLKLEPGKYTVSIYYPGDDTFKNSSFKDTFDLGPKDSENDTAGDPSTEVVSTETTHDGNLTTVTTTYADGHKVSRTTGTVQAYGDSNGVNII